MSKMVSPSQYFTPAGSWWTLSGSSETGRAGQGFTEGMGQAAQLWAQTGGVQ